MTHVSEWGKRNNMKKNDEFELMNNTPVDKQESEITKEDFVLQQADGTIHEQKFQTKPTTFFKDSLKRFRKNKSSVVAAYILGALVLLSIFVPIFNKNDVSNAGNAALKNLQPKLFDGGGFWDGTVKVKHKEIDAETRMPDPVLYYPSGVKDLVEEGQQFTNTPNKFGNGGYVQTGFYGGFNIEESYLVSTNPQENSSQQLFELDLTTSHLTLTNFVTVDEEMLKEDLGKKGVLPENFHLGNISLEFVYYNEHDAEKVIELVSPSVAHTIGLEGGEPTLNLNPIILDNEDNMTSFSSFYFRFAVSKTDTSTPEDHICSLIKSMVITTDSTDEREQTYFGGNGDADTHIDGLSFSDAMQMMVRSHEVGQGSSQRRNCGYWRIESDHYVKEVYLAKAYFASFTYDSYEATLGTRYNVIVSVFKLEEYQRNGWIDFEIIIDYVGQQLKVTYFDFTILNKNKCPIEKLTYEDDPAKSVENISYNASSQEFTYDLNCQVTYYKFLGYDRMPKYLFGTDKTGRDMFKYVFEGLRNSLLLGVLTFAVCFVIGLIWGAVSGYFGGAVDLVMERVTDILSGVPWIVVMTIIILKAGSSFGTFALALCLTGWIGTASTTRTQFYRFRGREYVLASRTLGASDARLIAKHILPNALGTIITGAVLMIPSVIFSEATISYLGLGFKNLSSLGVILSDNQSELTNHPYQLIFPSVVIALVMISFNLFGNGLRDAINPSLKGEDE